MRTRIFRRSRRRPGSHQPFFQSMKGGGEYVAAEGTFFPPSPVSVQPKLAIGQPGDKYEREADAMADRVVGQSSSANVLASSPPPAIQTMCAECAEEEGVQRQAGPLSLSPAPGFGDQGKLQRAVKEEEPEVQTQMGPLSPQLQRAMEEEEEPAVQTQMDPLSPRLQRAVEEEPEVQTYPLMRQAVGGQSFGTTALASKLSSSQGNGQPMAPQTNTFMSSAFGRDFGQVRIHTGSDAVQMNQGLNAKAFTHGLDIYFNRGQYNPESTAGRRLLAHELTHVVQQKEKKIHRKAKRKDNRLHIGEEQGADPMKDYQGSGSTSCDTASGRIIIAVTEHCAGDCVSQHENVHRRDRASCCRRVRRCIRRAGGNAARRTRCLTTFRTWWPRLSDWTEHRAYRREVQCLNRLIRRGCRRGGGIAAACCATLRGERAFARRQRGTHRRARRYVRCPFNPNGSIRP